jgi:uncharacterized membrane protein YecN with MAPEG domain
LGYDHLEDRKEDMMTFDVTPLYALPLAAIYLILWFRVSGYRARTKVSFGDSGDILLLRHFFCASRATAGNAWTG